MEECFNLLEGQFVNNYQDYKHINPLTSNLLLGMDSAVILLRNMWSDLHTIVVTTELFIIAKD